MKAITQNELLEALRLYGKAQARRPAGDGWHTLAELAETEGLTIPAIKYRIQQAQKQGVKIDLAPGTAIDGDGKARKTFYYRRNGK